MSWQEKVNKEYRITTGDGLTYVPYWMNAQKINEYNVSQFEFPEVEGSYVNRGKPKGRKFSIEIYFQANGREGTQNAGTDHLVEAELFETSAKDNRPWTIDHPFYGVLLVQPLSLTFDNKELNVTKITGTVVETIETTPAIGVDPTDNSRFQKATLDEVTNTSFVTEIPEPSSDVISTMQLSNNTIYNNGKDLVKNNLDAQAYFNLFNEANAAVLKATEFPLEAIRTVQAMINAPFLFIDSVKNRINILRTQFNQLVSTIVNITPTKKDKKVFENNGITLVSAITQAAIENPDYVNRVEVVEIIENILDTYDLLLETLDTFQSENGGDPDSYIPDAQSLTELSNLVSYTVANLLVISLTAKQERVLILEDDTNLVLLAHRLYGLQADDSTIQQIINENTIGLNEFLNIRKGRKITYYV